MTWIVHQDQTMVTQVGNIEIFFYQLLYGVMSLECHELVLGKIKSCD